MDNYAYQPEEITRRPYTINRHPSRSTGPNDYLVEINSRGKIFRRTILYKRLSVVLFILAIFFLIGLILLTILYTRMKPEICTSDECLRTASNLKYSLNLNVDPCDNFYLYTCGHWPEAHLNHGWWSSFSSFTTITERISIESLRVLTSDPSSLTEEPEALQKSRQFYKSCMNIEALDQLGFTVMYKYLRRARLPIIPSVFTKSNEERDNFTFDWMRSETLLKQIFLMDVFIGFTVDTNIYNGSENIIYIGKLYQRCPLPSPLNIKRYLESSKSRRNSKYEDGDERNIDMEKSINSNIIRYILKQIIINNTREQPDEGILQEVADILLNMTYYIQELNLNYTNPEETEEDTFAIKFSSLQSQTDRFLEEPHPHIWIKYFNYLFMGTNVTIFPETDLLYTTEADIQYLLRVLNFILGTSDLHIELYMWWVTIYAMIINTSSDVAVYITRQLLYYDSGSESSLVARSRSLDCALLVNNYMGYAISYALADESFPDKTKPNVERMMNNIKEAFVQHVNGINWMDIETKKATLEKSKEMITFIGYPEWLFKEGGLDAYYKDVIIKPDAYLENMLSLVLAHSLKMFLSLRVMHERDWHSEPIEVNAFNSFSDNAINVPMAILSFPIYNLGLEVLNYGSIGTILGHELTHGFDNMGRKHDKYGNYVQWWTNRTIETFESLTDCFVKQYDNFTIQGVEGHIKGKNTLGENLADNGGLSQAFTAYANYVQIFGEEPKLPGFENFTNHQMFFIAYGSIWCESSTIQDLSNQIEYDEHCPNIIRVLGTLQNSEDFAKAFNCPRGSFMNPSKKCKIW